jgi:glycerophosphoryl diester phosphodiesterase
LFAHRGASADLPENTLAAFAAGLAAGADRLELDVHASADGVVVVIHDAELDRTTNGRGLVRGLTFERLLRLDAGYGFAAGRGHRIPALDELLRAHPGVPLNIEIKQADPPIEDLVLATLDRHGARERTLLAAEHARIMERIRRAAPDVLTSHSAAEVGDFVSRLKEGRLAGYRPPGIAFQVPPAYMGTPIVTPEFVVAAHDLGTEVHVWTINEQAEMKALLDLGIDAIMTDVPALGVQVLRERGLR